MQTGIKSTANFIAWAAQVIAAVILLQTLYFKFTAAPESVYIFSALGAEPWGRIGSGIAELIVSVLLLIPRMAWLGALGGLAVISGAILSHLTILGIEILNDGGTLFMLAIAVFVCCFAVALLRRNQILQAVAWLRQKFK
ncbi:DoxX family protein [Sphingobacteriales bacterium UPWRP_1]|nr:DoxX family protein [Sphingobacteriales bacterium TSM_CSM]PSJ74579.1 DoxX family protein [Sphingobacteriales bacterium UPWRP_1]